MRNPTSASRRRLPPFSLARAAAALAAAALLPALARARCECGYLDDMGRLWTDAIVYTSFKNVTFNTDKSDLRITVNQLPNDSGIAGVPAPYQIQNDKDNVMLQGDDLLIRVKGGIPADGTFISSGEVVTMRTDIRFGTFRATMQTTANNGTCAGFFHYGDKTNEIDIEILSVQGPDQKVNFVQHKMNLDANGNPLPESLQNLDVGVNPSSSLNEYRFDWTPTASDFFVNSAKQTTLTANEPQIPGSVIFNHWAKGLQGWDQGPPTNDSFLRIKSFRLFFNTTDSTGFARRCNASTLAKVPLSTSRCNTETLTGNVTVLNDAAGLEKAVASSAASENDRNIANWSLYAIGIACGAIALMAAATFPIRYVRAQQYERALMEYRELNDEEGYDAHSGSSGGTLEMGKYGNGNQRWNGPKGWKWSYTEPPNFNTPLDNAKTQQGDISNGRYNNAKPPRKPNKTYAGPGGDRGDPRAWQGPPPDMPAPDYDDPADDSDATWAGNGPQRRQQQYAEPEMDRRNQNRKSVNGGRDRGGDHRGGDQYAQPAPSRRSESGNRPQYQQPPQSMAAPYAQSQRRPAEPQYPQSQYRQAPPQSNVQPRWASGNGRPPQGNGYGNSGIPGAMDVQGPPPSESEDERDMVPRNQPPRYNNGGGNGQGRRR